MVESRKRPLALTLIALLLGGLALSGLLNSFVWVQLKSTLPPDAPTHLREDIEAISSPLFSVVAFSYGVTAALASVGAWRMRSWAAPAVLAWGAAAVALGAVLLAVEPVPEGFTRADLILPAAGFIGLALLIVGAIWIYVRRAVPSASN